MLVNSYMSPSVLSVFGEQAQRADGCLVCRIEPTQQLPSSVLPSGYLSARSLDLARRGQGCG